MQKAKNILTSFFITIIVLGCTNKRNVETTYNMTYSEDNYQQIRTEASYISIDSIVEEQGLGRVAIAFLDIDYYEEIELYDKPHGVVTKKIKNDKSVEDFVNLVLIEKTNSMYYVVAFSSLTDSIFAKGWIRRDSPIGIYNCMYQGNTVFYVSPDSSKVLYVEKEYNPESYKVVDFCGSWLKVKIKKKSTFIEGWIPRNEQCWNVYSTCS